jgi:hypothetical protein
MSAMETNRKYQVRCEQLRKQMNVADTGYEKKITRSNCLSGGIAVIE